MRNLFVAAFAALVGSVIAVACGSGDKCEDVVCEAPLSCDPDDGKCKCGGHGGIECAEGFVCDQNANTCLSTRCAGVPCFGGTSCDVLDGTCKCGGTGGTVCAQNEYCDPQMKLCRPGQTCGTVRCSQHQACDEASGQCVCGAQQCGVGESCTVVATTNEKQCITDSCSGVRCLGSTSCDPADGRCKCNGNVCAPGEGCQCPVGSDGGTCADTARICSPVTACNGVTCTSGTTCDPTDGLCKCGGPGGPACGPDQVCSVTNFQCQGGNQCGTDGGTKNCSNISAMTSCDPEDGICKCGGRGGEQCSDGVTPGMGPEETCIIDRFSQTCRQKCIPIFQNCPAGEYCYVDTTAKITGGVSTPAYCSPPGDRERGQGCNSPTACFTTTPTTKGLHCHGLGTFEQPGGTGFCRDYCDTTVPNNGSCAQVPVPQTCVPINNAPAGWGYCQPQ